MGKVAKEGGESAAGAPVFLRKTYEMISTCDNSIASWYDNGSTFVVKDTERFAAEIIPEFFKHSNFSSFVRQLNFYGFRKIKSDPLRLKDAKSSEESKFWKFRHENFRKGRPDLLYQIKKNNADSVVDKHDVDQLRAEVRDLRSKLATTMKEVADLKTLVAASLYHNNDRSVPTNVFFPPVVAKKRRVDEEGSAVVTKEISEPFIVAAADGVVAPPVTVSSGDAVPMIPPPSAISTRFDSYDDDMIAYLSTLDKQDGLPDFFLADDRSATTPDPSAIPDIAVSLGDGIPYDEIAAVSIPSIDALAAADTAISAGALEGTLISTGTDATVD